MIYEAVKESKISQFFYFFRYYSAMKLILRSRDNDHALSGVQLVSRSGQHMLSSMLSIRRRLCSGDASVIVALGHLFQLKG